MNHRYMYSAFIVLFSSCMLNGMELNKGKDVPADSEIIDATRGGDIKGLRKLIKQGANINARDREWGATALHWAVGRGNKALVEFLIKETAIDVNAKNKLGTTALVFAAFQSEREIVRILLQHPKIDVNLWNKDGNTALHYAVEQQDKDMVELLLAKGAKNVYAGLLQSPLNIALDRHNDAIIQMLEKAFGLNQVLVDTIRFRVEDKELRDYEDITGRVKELIKKGADVNAYCAYKDGYTGFLYAVEGGLIDVVKILIEAGAKVDKPLEYGGGLSRTGLAPEQIAKKRGHHELANLLESYRNLRKYVYQGNMTQVAELLKQGLYVNARYYYDGPTLLHGAAENGNLEMVKLLISLGADMTLQDSNKHTPLDYAKERNHKEVVYYFYSLQLQHLAKFASEHQNKRK